MVGSSSSSGRKIREYRGLRGQASQTAADENFEATMRRAVVATDLRDEADVVDAGNRAIARRFSQPEEGDLELARQVVKIGIDAKRYLETPKA